MKCNICKATLVKDWQYCCDPCFKKEEGGTNPSTMLIEATPIVAFRDHMDKWLEQTRDSFVECINRRSLGTYLPQDEHNPTIRVPGVALRISKLDQTKLIPIPKCAEIILAYARSILKMAYKTVNEAIPAAGSQIETNNYANGWRIKSTIFDQNNKPLFRIYCGL